ncbi:hypothetical protein MSG28_009585 [Choristoneura fumiferana]|uniref:Uncharacterized protein n=1 Tax=Choristoneura fumiferana TaxID=7141 RepID=A0ACC0JBP5_CHOFU|nr:hypothetical protein MSG28_009585 [Choristoneura fumiferana]
MGLWSADMRAFMGALSRLIETSGDPRAGAYISQRISLTEQRDRETKGKLDIERLELASACGDMKLIEMEIVPEGKHFRLVTEDELPAVADVLVQYMPESLKTIQTYRNNKVWDFHFYVAKNWPEDPICLHFPGCTSTPNKDIFESVTVFCPSERAELVDLLTSEDVLLDLTQPLYLNFTHEAIVNRFERVYEAHDKITGDVYSCDTPPVDITAEELPPDVELVRLQPEHMKDVYDLYPASDIECREIFEKLVAELPAYGIFVEGQLAAWMVQSYYGAMFSMQTRPEFRRKGFGIYLARRLTKEVASRGYKPFVVIRPENDASRSLYCKLASKRFRTVRAVLRPR